jgi:hypothetical protein
MKKERKTEIKKEGKKERRTERRKEGKKERRKEGKKKKERKKERNKERKKDFFFLCRAQMMYQFNGRKMYKGNKSVLSFSKKVRNTFKI